MPIRSNKPQTMKKDTLRPHDFFFLGKSAIPQAVNMPIYKKVMSIKGSPWILQVMIPTTDRNMKVTRGAARKFRNVLFLLFIFYHLQYMN